MQRLKKNFLFITVCSGITILLVLSYGLFVSYFSEHNESLFEIKELKARLQREKLNSTLVRYQLKDYQQAVALALPENKSLLDSGDQIRGIASVSFSKSDQEAIDLSGVYFQRGKSFFQEKDYDSALVEFSKILSDFPLSPYTVEAYFFTAESYYLIKSYKKSLNIIDIMVTQFPDHKLTGFILLRMGQISESQRHMSEALEIYRTVESHFDHTELRLQARKMIDSLESR